MDAAAQLRIFGQRLGKKVEQPGADYAAVAPDFDRLLDVDAELARAEHRLDPPVVSVQALTFARREPELMGRSDRRLLANFPHLRAT